MTAEINDPWRGAPARQEASTAPPEVAARRQQLDPLWAADDTCNADLVEWMQRGRLVTYDGDTDQLVEQAEIPRRPGNDLCVRGGHPSSQDLLVRQVS